MDKGRKSMKLSQKQLKQIISEELNTTIEEDRPPDSHVEAALEYFRTKVDPNDENSWKHWEIMAKWFANLGYKIVAEEFNTTLEEGATIDQVEIALDEIGKFLLDAENNSKSLKNWSLIRNWLPTLKAGEKQR